MSKYGLGLMRFARLNRRNLVAFALFSAVINGIVTAVVGSWLAQTYAQHQSRRQSIESIANLFYARRTQGGMVASTLRRNADLEELRHRKRAYDEAYVEWNTHIRRNLFVIREVMGQATFAALEQQFEDELVAVLAEIDTCLTKAYDTRLSGGDPLPVLDACQMPVLHQFALDCGATFTNELYKLTRLSFIPFVGAGKSEREAAEARIAKVCRRATPATRPESPAAPPPKSDAAAAPGLAKPSAGSAPQAETGTK